MRKLPEGLGWEFSKKRDADTELQRDLLNLQIVIVHCFIQLFWNYLATLFFGVLLASSGMAWLSID